MQASLSVPEGAGELIFQSSAIICSQHHGQRHRFRRFRRGAPMPCRHILRLEKCESVLERRDPFVAVGDDVSPLPIRRVWIEMYLVADLIWLESPSNPMLTVAVLDIISVFPRPGKNFSPSQKKL